MRMTQITILAVVAGGAVCLAQAPAPLPAPTPDVRPGNMFFYAAGPGAVGAISGGFAFDNHVVKGLPYTADTSNETTQTLGDGNRIVRKETGSAARDSEGRTRREMSTGGVGPRASGGEPAKMIFINDPVAQVNYVLTPEHTAHKTAIPPKVLYASSNGGEPKPLTATVKGMAEAKATVRMGGTSKEESLGPQMMEGVQADGKRMTTTIPAGEMGNERPLEIVSETWYSSDLQVIVMTRRSDPRNGETVYKLTNIQRVEPPQSMFEVPSDYKVEDGLGEGVKSIRIEKVD